MPYSSITRTTNSRHKSKGRHILREGVQRRICPERRPEKENEEAAKASCRRAVFGEHVLVQEAVKVESSKDVVVGDVDRSARVELTLGGVLMTRAGRRGNEPVHNGRRARRFGSAERRCGLPRCRRCRGGARRRRRPGERPRRSVWRRCVVALRLQLRSLRRRQPLLRRRRRAEAERLLLMDVAAAVLVVRGGRGGPADGTVLSGRYAVRIPAGSVRSVAAERRTRRRIAWLRRTEGRARRSSVRHAWRTVPVREEQRTAGLARRRQISGRTKGMHRSRTSSSADPVVVPRRLGLVLVTRTGSRSFPRPRRRLVHAVAGAFRERDRDGSGRTLLRGGLPGPDTVPSTTGSTRRWRKRDRELARGRRALHAWRRLRQGHVAIRATGSNLHMRDVWCRVGRRGGIGRRGGRAGVGILRRRHATLLSLLLLLKLLLQDRLLVSDLSR